MKENEMWRVQLSSDALGDENFHRSDFLSALETFINLIRQSARFQAQDGIERTVAIVLPTSKKKLREIGGD